MSDLIKRLREQTREVEIGGVTLTLGRPDKEGLRAINSRSTAHMKGAMLHANISSKDMENPERIDHLLKSTEEAMEVVALALQHCLRDPVMEFDDALYLIQMAFYENSEIPDIVGKFCGINRTVKILKRSIYDEGDSPLD